MNIIKLNYSEINDSKVTYEYEISGEWSKYFTKKRKYSVEYTENIGKTPISIANIQFILHFLPMIWIFDGKLYVDEIDKDFYSCIDEIKKGYINMYPMIDFKGEILAKKIISNKYEVSKKVGAFYSGGLDATSTLITHYNEKPILINLQGSDINLKYNKVLNNMKASLEKQAKDLDLNIIFVKTEFRSIINEERVDKYLKPLAKDNYWHGFQHGIAIIGHAATIAYKYKLKTIYIASSFTKDVKYTCASDPTIDNFVKLASTNIIHDGYEYNRNAKCENISQFIKNNNKKITLRVCLNDYIVENCCHCEKCYRTIFCFASKGCDPQSVGFNLNTNDYKKIEKDFKNRVIYECRKSTWENIQKEFLKHPELKNNQHFAWIYTIDLNKNKKRNIKYIYKVKYALTRRIKKIIKFVF